MTEQWHGALSREAKRAAAQRKYNAEKEYAVRILTHYLKTATERGGGQWDSDNDAEVAGVVDLLATMMDLIRNWGVTP